MLPGPLALLSGLFKDTIDGDTKTAKDPSSVLRVAVPISLIVFFNIFAYSKSIAVILDIPLVGTVVVGIVFPNANFANIFIR